MIKFGRCRLALASYIFIKFLSFFFSSKFYNYFNINNDKKYYKHYCGYTSATWKTHDFNVSDDLNCAVKHSKRLWNNNNNNGNMIKIKTKLYDKLKLILL